MTLSEEVLRRSIPNRPFRFFESIDSTNRIAAEWIVESPPDGSVVIADQQLAGRGRKQRNWHTPPGSAIALSYIYRPKPENVHLGSMIASVAVLETIQATHTEINVSLKWPNDVLINGKKVCGILPEAVWENDELKGIVLGIGMNVMVDFGDTELADKAISLHEVVPESTIINRMDLILSIINNLDELVYMNPSTIFERWQSQLSTIGEYVQISDSSIRGIADSVDSSGKLWIRTDDGKLEPVIAGDVLPINQEP